MLDRIKQLLSDIKLRLFPVIVDKSKLVGTLFIDKAYTPSKNYINTKVMPTLTSTSKLAYSFLKTKVASPASVLVSKVATPTAALVVPLVLIIGVILFYSTDSILSKFGVQTRTDAMVELAKSQSDINTAKYTNEKLAEQLAIVNESKEKTLEAIEIKNETINEATSNVITIKSTSLAKQKEVAPKLEASSSTSDRNYTMDKEVYDTLSSINIEALNSAFDTLHVS